MATRTTGNTKGKMLEKTPCRFFQIGNCQKGDACRHAHVRDPKFKRKACPHFAKGRCQYGTSCNFSHVEEDIDLLRATSGANTNNTGDGRGGSTESQFRDWRYNISTEVGTPRPLGPRMTNFCKQALELVDGEVGVMQEVMVLLASNGGLQRISELVDQPFDRLSNAQLIRIFNTQILPVFKIITHKNVVASVVLGPRLMTIYNIIYNGDGERAVSLFSAVTKHLLTLSLVDVYDNEAANDATVDALENTLAALYKLVEINTQAQVHDGLKLAVETLALLFEDPVSKAVVFAIKPAQKHLRRIEQRMGLGQALPHQADNVKVAGARATFELARERPGELSEDGPRHDNDSVNIRQISILPTLQEIQSSRVEYLPLADPREWHLGGLEGLLDRHFRLLREDTVGQLRDAAKFELERLQNPQAQVTDSKRKRQGARTYIYGNVAVSNIAFDAHSGIEFALSFDQPKDLKHKSTNQRQEWWQGSKRLGDDALVCLLSSFGSVIFLIVVPEPKFTKKDTETGKDQIPLHKNHNCWSDPDRAHVVAKPVKQTDIKSLLNQLLSSTIEHFSLVEFPGVLLPAFQPTLQAMQRMSDSLDVPFSNILAPVATQTNPDQEVDLQPPAYATRPGFQFNLSKVTMAGRDLRLTPGADLDNKAVQLAANSTFDLGQAQAVVFSLSRSFALIQGPPGTGKSYTGVQLINILLDNKKAADLGPIVCVCFTNHALDQSLERLLDEGVDKVIRIGGRSKSERLAEVNLRSVVQRLSQTKTEKADRWDLLKKVDDEEREINGILGGMGQLNSQAAVEEYLKTNYPDQYQQLFSKVDEDRFTKVNYHPDAVMERWLGSTIRGFDNPRSVNELVEVHILNMTGRERRRLYDYWLVEMKEDLHNRLNIALRAYNGLKAKLDDIRTELDLRVLRQANIIGITTSGLARNLNLLRRINAKVLLCEEAGEVLESHCLTALLPSVEHAILIGDHEQLRPHVQNYELSTESKNGAQYSLDVSLFERLVQPQDIFAQRLPLRRLEVQRRMHPSISQLARRTLYPQLQDAPGVSRYPGVVGMRQRLFWLHHEVKECGGDGDAMATSHTNDYEVEMTAALVKHLVRQGVYASNDIAVITPYLGQLRKIRKKLGGTFEIVLNEQDVDDLEKDGGDEDLPLHKAPRRTSVARGTLLQALRVATVDNFQGEEAKVVVVSLVRSNAKNNPGFLRTSNRINVLLSRAQHGMYIIGNANTTANVSMWAKITDIFREDGNFGTDLQLCCPRHEDTLIAVNKPEDFYCLEVIEGVDVELGCGHHQTFLPCYQHQDTSTVRCEVPMNRTVPGCLHEIVEPCYMDVDDENKLADQCASNDVKDMEADMFVFEKYGDVNLDEDPCIFVACGHMFTLKTMDGIMDMAAHYESDPATGDFTSIKTSSVPFSSEELKSCPACRGSLRSISRYGRIIRRASLDESAKKLTAWSNRNCQDLQKRLVKEQQCLLSTIDNTLKPYQNVKLGGKLRDQMDEVKSLKTDKRYRQIFAIRNTIDTFADKLSRDEQPYQRVRDLVETVRRHTADPGIAEFHFPSEELQLREHLLATSLLIRADILILTDVISMHNKTAAGARKGALQVDFNANRASCEAQVIEAELTSNVRQQVEGHIFWARFAAMECGTLSVIDEEAKPGMMHHLDSLKKYTVNHLNDAEKICAKFSGGDVNPTKGLAEEAADVRRMLEDGVSSSEMRMVVAAMAAEFSGTETLLDTGGSLNPEDSNLYDALLLNAKRIGYRYGLLKNPMLMEQYKQQNIALKLCPTLDSSSLSYEFYQVMVGDTREMWMAEFVAQACITPSGDENPHDSPVYTHTIKHNALEGRHLGVGRTIRTLAWDWLLDEVHPGVDLAFTKGRSAAKASLSDEFRVGQRLRILIDAFEAGIVLFLEWGTVSSHRRQVLTDESSCFVALLKIHMPDVLIAVPGKVKKCCIFSL
ncbi:hypothetical protein LTR08_003723 [Meristemomyces frigidus]|nr:hypothetical protein LTR08_003723 [Meristemomyces frigidus]